MKKIWIGRPLGFVLQGGELLLKVFTLGPKLRAAFFEVADEILVRLVDEFHVAQQSLALDLGVVDGPTHRGEAIFAFPLPRRVECPQVAIEQVVSGAAEDLGGQEVVEPVQQAVLADPEARWMAFGSILLLRDAHVVRRPDPGVRDLAEVASAADGADHVAAQRVDPFRIGVDVGARGGTGALPALADLLGLDEGFQVYQRLVGGCRGPYPLLHRIGAVLAFALAGFAVPDHVACVLGVAEHVPDVGVRPSAHRSVRLDGDRWGMGDQVEVQEVGDGLVTEAVDGPPGEPLANHRPLHGVDL